MKQLRINLDDTWTECLKMWRWIVRHKNEDRNIINLKIRYIQEVWQLKHKDIKAPQNNCFFCDKDKEQRRKHTSHSVYKDMCSCCPGVLEDHIFDCWNVKYSYAQAPKLFLEKLESLNRKRKRI